MKLKELVALLGIEQRIKVWKAEKDKSYDQLVYNGITVDYSGEYGEVEVVGVTTGIMNDGLPVMDIGLEREEGCRFKSENHIR